MLSVESALAATAALVASAFGLVLADQWLTRRTLHEALWATTLLAATVSWSLAWAGLTLGWDPPVYRLWVLVGPVLTLPLLAAGAVVLVRGWRRAAPWAIGLGLLAAGSAAVVAAPLDAALPVSGWPDGATTLATAPRLLSAVTSGMAGALVLASTVASTIRLARGAAAASTPTAVVPRGALVGGNVLLAISTLVLAGLAVLGTGAAPAGAPVAYAAVGVAAVGAAGAGMVLSTAAPRRPDERATPPPPPPPLPPPLPHDAGGPGESTGGAAPGPSGSVSAARAGSPCR